MSLNFHRIRWAAIRSSFPVVLMVSLMSCVWIGPAMSQSGGDRNNGDWPQCLGPQRNGISTETGLLEGWSANGPKEVWRVAGGVGMSGLAISRGL